MMVKGFGNELCAAGGAGFHPLIEVTDSRDKNDRHGRLFPAFFQQADLLGQFKSIHFRHHHVHRDDVEAVFLNEVEDNLTAPGNHRGIADAFETVLHRLAGGGFIVNTQDERLFERGHAPVYGVVMHDLEGVDGLGGRPLLGGAEVCFLGDFLGDKLFQGLRHGMGTEELSHLGIRGEICDAVVKDAKTADAGIAVQKSAEKFANLFQISRCLSEELFLEGCEGLLLVSAERTSAAPAGCAFVWGGNEGSWHDGNNRRWIEEVRRTVHGPGSIICT